MKKLLSIVLSLLIIFTLIPMGTITVNAATSGTTGDCTWSLDGTVLTISGNGKMGDYDYYNYPQSPWGTSITKVIIKEGVTSIGYYAFSWCSSLTSITIPDSVTSIGSDAFSWCSSLTSIKIPDSVTSIGGEAFYNCSSLTSITISDTVTSIGDYAFCNCSSLTSITIPDSVTSIGDYAFYNTGYYNDTTNWEDGVLYISNHLIDAETSIAGEYAIKANTKSIGGSAFSSCIKLTSITIPDSVKSIGDSAFRGCTSLTSITIPDGVTSIGEEAFSYCSSLTSITIPDGVTSIGEEAFYKCSSLTSITIPDSVTGIGDYAFYYTGYYNDTTNWEDGVLYISNHLIKAETSIAGKYAIKANTKSIGNYAFSYCSSLTSIKIPDSVKSIGDSAFRGCTSLTSITIPDGVTSIGDYAFCSCSSLTSITIPDSVTSIGNYAFSYCSLLTSIKIPDSVTSIGEEAFSYCSSLTSVTIGNSVTSIGYRTFYNCSSLTSVTIGNSVTSIGVSAFEYCSKLTSITIPDSVTSIGDYAFSSCRSLKSVYITDIDAWCKIKFSDSSSNPMYDGANLYVNNQPFTSFKMSENTEIWDTCTFYNCKTLENVFIPKSMVLIKQNAFYGCSGIKNVYFEGTAEEWAAVTILSGNDYLKNATVYYNSTDIPGGVTSITVSKLPQKLKYIENEEDLDLSGGILTVNYDGGATKDIDLATLTAIGFDNTVLGKQTITVKYGDFSAEFQVEVTVKPIDFIALSKLPDKTYYTFGESLDLTGGEIFILYEAGDYQKLPLTADMVAGFNGNKAGAQALTVKYKGYATKFVVMVYKQSTPDFNGDGKTNVLDYIYFNKILAGDTESDSANPDLDKNGILNSSDLIVLKKYLLGIVK